MTNTSLTCTLRTAVLTLGTAVVAVGLASAAQAAPSGPGSAQDTVDQLRLNGYRVVVAQTGAKPLSQCSVTSVREGTTVHMPLARPGSTGVSRYLAIRPFMSR